MFYLLYRVVFLTHISYLRKFIHCILTKESDMKTNDKNVCRLKYYSNMYAAINRKGYIFKNKSSCFVKRNKINSIPNKSNLKNFLSIYIFGFWTMKKMISNIRYTTYKILQKYTSYSPIFLYKFILGES